MGIYYCTTDGCGGYFCSVGDMYYHPHEPHCENYEAPSTKDEKSK